MSIAARKHDLIAVQVYDRRDASLPDVGMMRVADLETGADRWIDTSNKKSGAPTTAGGTTASRP